MKKRTVNFLWILVIILITSIGIFASIKDIDAEGEKNIGQRAILCMVAAVLACSAIWRLAKDEGRKEAKKELKKRFTVSELPTDEDLEVLLQTTDGDFSLLWLAGPKREKEKKSITCLILNAMLLDKDGQMIKGLPEKFRAVQGQKQAIRKEDEYIEIAEAKKVYYIFPLTEKQE